MGIITCVTSLIFMVLSLIFKKNNKLVNPVVFFFGLWFVILFLSVLNWFQIIKPSDNAYCLIFLMLIFFFIGNIINYIINNNYIKIPKILLKKENDNKEEKNIKIVSVLFYGLSFFIIIFYLIDIRIIIEELIAGTPMWQIRNWSLEKVGSINPILRRRSFLEEAFRNIILAPFSTIIPPITAYYFLNYKNNKQRYILLANSLIILILSSVAGGGGRLGFIYYFGCFLLAFIAMCKSKKVSEKDLKKFRKIIIIFMILSILFMTFYTIFRTGLKYLIQEVYTYFALPPTLLSVWLPEIENTTNTYGLLTSFGIHSYFFRVFDVVGLDFLVPQIYYDTYNHIINAEIFRNVGYGNANAFVTPIYYFYIDGGYIFVCLASLFFGYIVWGLYEKLEKNINLRTFSLYSLIMYGIFLTFMRVQTAIPEYIISFFFVFIILKTFKNKEKDNEEDKVIENSKLNEELISVIVPIYNVEKYIKNCIDSIIDQTYANLEIILVDDGSPDNCGKICDEYAKKDKRVKVIHKENEGVSSARNIGLEKATGQFITFIDADDYVTNNYCEELLNTIKKENADCVACGYFKVYGKRNENIVSEESYALKEKEFLKSLFLVQNGLGFCHMKLWKKSVIENVKFNENLTVGEDALFNMKASKYVKKFYMLNKPLYFYRFSETSVVRSFDTKYVDKYLYSMNIAAEYIKESCKEELEIIEKFNNYVVYHVLLIIINYCTNTKNNLNFIGKMRKISEVCNIKEFKEAISNCNYEGLSLTRKITLFTIKYKLYIVTTIIGIIRQKQFKNNITNTGSLLKDEKK